MHHITTFPRAIVEHADMGITMPDGCRLSARVWMPVDAADDPVPVILEHLPYRKRDGTIVRDAFSHPWFAGHGYAVIRTDMRGSGESEGLLTDEYTAQELDDACAVIAWAAAQPWSNGSVGMMGISWGGFNGLQVAALNPPALKAVITICSTVDRYADDIHYKGGCLLAENFGWSANMLSYSSRPPDPALVGGTSDGFLTSPRERGEVARPGEREAGTDGRRVRGDEAENPNQTQPSHPSSALRAPSPRPRGEGDRGISVGQSASINNNRWKDMWLNRLEHQPWHLETWLAHPNRDEYWKHGSVCEDYSAITAAVLSIGGWHDGYRNTISHLVENLDAPVKGIVGPWNHKYPHYAGPKPAIGFLQEAKRWWDKWLKGQETGVEDDPDYRAYLMDSLAPQRWWDERPGRWIAEADWPADRIEKLRFYLGGEADSDSTSSLRGGRRSEADPGGGNDIAGLTEIASEAPIPPPETATQFRPPLKGEVGSQDAYPAFKGALTSGPQEIAATICSPADCGTAAGEYFPFAFGDELPDEQSVDDARSLCFDGAVLEEAIDIVGAPEIKLRLSSNKPKAQIAVRLCDLRPDGTSAHITYGVLNLAHAASHEHPELLTPGQAFDATITLDQIAYRIPAGHRLRVAISTSYWPTLWPAPKAATLTILGGEFSLPSRPLAEGDEWEFEEPEAAAPWQAENLRASSYSRETRTDPKTGDVHVDIFSDFGENRDSDHGLISGSWAKERWSIHPDNPLSAKGTSEWEQTGGRAGQMWRTHIEAEMTCDAENFHHSAKLTVFLEEKLIFQRDHDHIQPRNVH